MDGGVRVDDDHDVELIAGRDQRCEQPVERRTLAGTLAVVALVDVVALAAHDLGRSIGAVVRYDMDGEQFGRVVERAERIEGQRR